MISTECDNCGRAFMVKPFRLKNAKTLYCSRKCHHRSMEAGIKVRCNICQKELKRTSRQVKASRSGKFFCDKSCQTKWRNRYFSGERHGRWKGGANVQYRKKLKNSNAQERCLRCGKDDDRILAVHHIDENRRNNKLDNLCWLCHNCHYLIHHDEGEKKKLDMAAIV